MLAFFLVHAYEQPKACNSEGPTTQIFNFRFADDSVEERLEGDYKADASNYFSNCTTCNLYADAWQGGLTDVHNLPNVGVQALISITVLVVLLHLPLTLSASLKFHLMNVINDATSVNAISMEPFKHVRAYTFKPPPNGWVNESIPMYPPSHCQSLISCHTKK
ncbi:unnamed protein product [Ceratitis capitata]|uniref:(Mediterranean fruit fly) hypothetical protein n=1 Tax=Ceratitis capitata TaxID=7213 RepID=A0A811V6C1_CERCA|nr:unnamed protein product [Ceratitis capitata]